MASVFDPAGPPLPTLGQERKGMISAGLEGLARNIGLNPSQNAALVAREQELAPISPYEQEISRQLMGSFLEWQGIPVDKHPPLLDELVPKMTRRDYDTLVEAVKLGTARQRAQRAGGSASSKFGVELRGAMALLGKNWQLESSIMGPVATALKHGRTADQIINDLELTLRGTLGRPLTDEEVAAIGSQVVPVAQEPIPDDATWWDAVTDAAAKLGIKAAPAAAPAAPGVPAARPTGAARG